ncbi:hypothetical protein JVU11DRAFT_11836 [Chiua virens]|nr:hypothetical protein JVU11DRAFT_11836 [Chiua virens]
MSAHPTLQHVYATNLDQQLGYPLRNPQLHSPDPEEELGEPYKSEGLQIGDIGHVDEYGAFNLLFNVNFPPNECDDLDQSSELNLPLHFGQKIQPGVVFMTGVSRILDGARTDAPQVYKFVAKANKGAILILPTGAILFELESEYLEIMLDHVKKHALAWCRHAQRDVLCLITAVYRARSWTLGSFKKGVIGEEIRVLFHSSEQNGTPGCTWESAFNVDSQQVSPGNTDLNQAIFIKGFKIRVRLELLEMPVHWSARLLTNLRVGSKQLVSGAGIKIEYFPNLDSRQVVELTSKSIKPSEIPRKNSQLVITYMRLESFDIDHVDSGICAFVQFGTMTRRTNSKPYASIIEWDDEIMLPSDIPAHVTVCGTFQLGSTLGTREVSAKKTINTSDMSGSKYNLNFSVGSTESCSSLLITLERRFSYHRGETHFSLKKGSDFVQTTTRGFENFYSYHREHEKGYLDAALDCFGSALRECGLDPGRLATTRFNIATTEFLRCQVHGTYAEIDKAIKLYKEVLQLWGEGHPDRPAAILLLAQALLSHHEQELSIREIEQLLEEIPPGDSRNRQTADTILATCGFYHAISAENLGDIDHLLANFERGVYTPPYGYFDQPHLLHKLGFAFWRRFRSSGNIGAFHKAIMLNAEALEVSDGHDDQKNIAVCLGNSLLCALQSRGLDRDDNTSVELLELGKKVIAILNGTSYAKGASASSEGLQEQMDPDFLVAQLREQIKVMESVEGQQQAAADNIHESFVRQDPSRTGAETRVRNNEGDRAISLGGK